MQENHIYIAGWRSSSFQCSSDEGEKARLRFYRICCGRPAPDEIQRVNGNSSEVITSKGNQASTKSTNCQFTPNGQLSQLNPSATPYHPSSQLVAQTEYGVNQAIGVNHTR